MELKTLDREGLERLYHEELERVFSDSERRPLGAMLRLLEMGRYEALLAIEEGEPIGYAMLWLSEAPDSALLEYLGVLRGKRNGGAGSQILTLLGERYQQLFGEAEAPDTGDPEEDDLRRRRIGFYLRNGFRVLDYMCALFGVRFHCLYRGPELDDRKVQELHRRVYSDYFSQDHMERYIQLPLAPDEPVHPAPRWMEEDEVEA
ncbi:GNAT family N-acetyltransferase [Intestinimonas butyriciproducens]|uniref:GNAT family N-acetyltransferase n=1 Tax=Intestinimonas butyriciproducens TaxID=1297617 RepID=UPI00195EFE56|nr:GNAT family N-acetyltransferase [Intestinimonas butyriciproducens]MBM6976374.1 GNAT family N-acetyltransferase [Intestinimonas butyriciproducens]